MYFFCLLVSQFDLLELVSQRFTCQQWLWRHSDSVGCFHWIKDQIFSGTPCQFCVFETKTPFPLPPSPFPPSSPFPPPFPPFSHPPALSTLSTQLTIPNYHINDFQLRTLVFKEEKETEITHVLVNLKNNWSASPIISLLHAITSWPFVFVRRNMKRDAGAWISITLIQNFWLQGLMMLKVINLGI